MLYLGKTLHYYYFYFIFLALYCAYNFTTKWAEKVIFLHQIILEELICFDELIHSDNSCKWTCSINDSPIDSSPGPHFFVNFQKLIVKGFILSCLRFLELCVFSCCCFSGNTSGWWTGERWWPTFWSNTWVLQMTHMYSLAAYIYPHYFSVA